MTENLLQAGVTKPCLDPTLRSTWLAAVHESVRDQSISFISDVEDPAVGRNYYRVNVQLRHGEPFSLLLNAFCQPGRRCDTGGREHHGPDLHRGSPGRSFLPSRFFAS